MKHMVRHLVCLATVAGLIFGAQAESAGELAVEPIPDQAFTGAAVGAGAESSPDTTDGQEVELCAYEPTPIDIGICSDATCYQCDLGGGVYLLGFTNVTVEAMTFAPFLPCRIEKMLIVGGGGAGGYNCGGGGGGGGVIYADNLSLKAEDRPVISSLMSVLVAPGALRTATDGVGANGGHTKVTFGETSYVAYGGGGGGYWPSGGTPRAAAVTGEIGSGGGVSNGGPGKYNVDKTCYNSEQGNHGGMNIGDLAGGGGGAGGVGGSAAKVDNVRYAGKGGIGFSCAITGETHLYGSGGSGGQGTADREAYEGGGIGGKQSPGTVGGNGTNGLGGGGGGGAGGKAGGGGGSGCCYLVVQVIDSGKVAASISDYNGVAVEGEAYSNELTVVTADAQVRWSRTSETGPFDLSVQPFYTTAGIYTNWCEITAAGKDALVLQGVVRLRPENGDYYVAPDGSDMVGLGDEAMPFATIKKALEWIRPGFAVRLAPGTYRESGLEIGQAVTLAGDNADLSRCVIDADNKGRALTLSHAGAQLTGLTIRNGLASGGANVYMTDGVVSNCVLTGGNGNASDNGGNVYMSGGWLVDSQILNGSARRGGGATVAGDGRVVRCLFKGNNVTDSGGGVSINGNGVVENSLVVGNTGNYGAGVQINSQNAWLVNSTVAGNNGTWNVFQENGGGRLANVVSYGKHYIKKGSIEYCGLTTEPSREGSGHTIEHNVTIDASVFEDTTSYRPKKGLALHGAGSNSRYAEHAVSETDYEGNLRRRGLRIDIGHVELPPKDGTTLFLL